MFSKILIANRGEIACRVIRTARRMGVETVAVYSDADAKAMHVRMADQAVHIGPPPVSESYLRQETIIEAALAVGAEAIHPGYGFLSENPDFIEAVEAAGLTFIGPSAKSVRAMGLKDAAKALMEKAGVPVVPGYHGDMQEPGFLAAKANEVGYPVLIKARAGGGGKGMRRVDDAKQFSAALASCRSEAKSSFGDDRVLIEKYVTAPRHIEVQVFGDNHGNVVHLFERDCSLQRRHQKVIEEAPAPGMTAEMREAMTSAAVTAAKAIDYSGAGTIEFIVDGSQGLKPDGFYFMEMNTRLQVEHPVTEAITGVDLVEWQLQVAAGASIPLKQDKITMRGHAFEARLYAEDVEKGFLPAIGTLEHLDFSEGARIDTGVEQGDAISPFYDPMIAKVISQGKDRDEALTVLRSALVHTRVAGTVTNKRFLAALCEHAGFMAGNVDTGLIERDIAELTQPPRLARDALNVALIEAFFQAQSDKGRPTEPFDTLAGFRLWGTQAMIVHMTVDGQRCAIRLTTADRRHFTCAAADTKSAPIFPKPWELMLTQREASSHNIKVIADGKEIVASVAHWPHHIAVFVGGETHEFAFPDLSAGGDDAQASGDKIVAPMPGLVKALTASVGQQVTAGEPLVVLEAMKMEHTLSAPRDGTIAQIGVSQGDQVVDGTVLIALEIAGDAA